MSEKTKIEWAEATWNPWYGCHHVSPGCAHCYAERDMARFGKDFSTVTRAAPATFYGPLRWKVPRRIFTCSWSDFFIHEADEWREEAWDVILKTPWHTYMVLTKRPGLMVSWSRTHPWPDHVWAGVSVDSQRYARWLDVLKRVPAKVRFVSAEPLLSELDLTPWLDPDGEHYIPGQGWVYGQVLHWVIVGGESGPMARTMEMGWLETIEEDCRLANVPVFVKQDSGLYPGRQGHIPDRLWEIKEIPDER